MAGDEFNIVEGPALQQLQTLGWEYMDGTLLSPEVSDERDYSKTWSYRSVSLSVQRLNPWISDENLRKVVRDVTMGQYAIWWRRTSQFGTRSTSAYLSSKTSVWAIRARPCTSLISKMLRTMISCA